MSTHSTAHGSDIGAAFTGLIIGAIVVGLILYGVVRVTAHHYASEKPVAEATH
jgi:uncharacterized protein (DUF983 family)